MGKEETILEKKIGTVGWWLEKERKKEKKNSPKKEDGAWVSGIELKRKMVVWKKRKNAPLRERLVAAHKEGWKEGD